MKKQKQQKQETPLFYIEIDGQQLPIFEGEVIQDFGPNWRARIGIEEIASFYQLDETEVLI